MKKNLLIIALILFECLFSQTVLERDHMILDLSALQKISFGASAPKNKIRNQKIEIIQFDGKKMTFILNENTLSNERTNEIVTFDGISEDKNSKMKLSLFKDHMNAVVFTPDGYFIIEPVDAASGKYKIYQEITEIHNVFCGVKEQPQVGIQTKKTYLNYPYGSKLRTYRMAVATTGEFTQAWGSQDLALAEATNMVNLINLIYENELSVTFKLITETSNKSLIFPNPNTDPFSGSGAGASQSGFDTLNANGSLLYNKYDIGHMFGLQSSGASGTAGGTPCYNPSKASGGSAWAYNPDPNASKAWIARVIAHEIGHQFGAGHTFNGSGGTASNPNWCNNNWNSYSAVEPGSGVSMMSYEGQCYVPNDQTNTPAKLGLKIFHTFSLDQMLSQINGESNCFSNIQTSNIPPHANAGPDITIPKNTPFKLKGIASDSNDTGLLYTWDQTDVATTNDKGAMGSTIAGNGGYTAVNSITAPLFRTEPSKTTERYFPKLEYVVNNENNPPIASAEMLSQVARNIKLRFTVRDNNTQAGGVDSDEMIVTVNNDGPLSVTYPNASGLSFAALSTVNVTWDVNSTNNIKNEVNILLSIDGGYTYPITLAANTPNNGLKSITIPNVPATTSARIKVVAVINDNAEFFDISNNNFTITSNCDAYPSYAYPTSVVYAIAGSSQADLNMTAPLFAGPEVTILPITYSPANLTSNNLIIYQNSSMVTPVFSDVRLGLIQKFKVTESGNYKFTRNAGYIIMTVSSGYPFTTSNFITSNGFINSSGSVSIYSSTESRYLEAGVTYYFLFASGSSGTIYDITVTGPGKVYTENPPTSGYSYVFAAVNISNGNIDAVSPTANFTSLPVGSYTIIGFSYPSTTNISSFINQTISSSITSGICVNLSKTSRSLMITSSLNTKELEKHTDIGIFPNPVIDELNIDCKKEITDFEIIDFSGRLIIKDKFRSTKISVKNLTSNIYIIRFYKESKLIYQTKFIKK